MLVASAKIRYSFDPDQAPTKSLLLSGSILFDTLMVLLKIFFEMLINFGDYNHEKLPSMQRLQMT